MAAKAEELPPAPAHLSDESRALWDSIVRTRARSPGRLALLQAGLEAKDRADEARRLIASEGIMSRGTTGKMGHCHPAVRIEKEARAQFSKIWSDLSLGWDISVDGRMCK